MNIVEMTARFSPQQTQLMKKVCSRMKIIECFEYEGAIFKGNRFTAAVEFAHNNPTGGDFYVWLQDNYTRLTRP